MVLAVVLPTPAGRGRSYCAKAQPQKGTEISHLQSQPLFSATAGQFPENAARRQKRKQPDPTACSPCNSQRSCKAKPRSCPVTAAEEEVLSNLPPAPARSEGRDDLLPPFPCCPKADPRLFHSGLTLGSPVVLQLALRCPLSPAAWRLTVYPTRVQCRQHSVTLPETSLAPVSLNFCSFQLRQHTYTAVLDIPMIVL